MGQACDGWKGVKHGAMTCSEARLVGGLRMWSGAGAKRVRGGEGERGGGPFLGWAMRGCERLCSAACQLPSGGVMKWGSIR